MGSDGQVSGGPHAACNPFRVKSVTVTTLLSTLPAPSTHTHTGPHYSATISSGVPIVAQMACTPALQQGAPSRPPSPHPVAHCSLLPPPPQQGLRNLHFDKVVQHLGATLAELGVPQVGACGGPSCTCGSWWEG